MPAGDCYLSCNIRINKGELKKDFKKMCDKEGWPTIINWRLMIRFRQLMTKYQHLCQH